MTVKEIKVIRKDYTSRINEGIAWLDLNNPSWLKKINVELLNLQGTSTCILGQAYKDFWESESNAAVSGGLSVAGSNRLAFSLIGEVDDDGDSKYDILTMLWYEKLVRLRKQRGLDKKKAKK